MAVAAGAKVRCRIAQGRAGSGRGRRQRLWAGPRPA